MLDEVNKGLKDRDPKALDWTEGDYSLKAVSKRLSTSLELPSSWDISST